MGGLGFMADIPITDIYPCLEELLEGKYEIQERVMIQGNINSGESCFAVNDIVIHRAQNPSLVDLSVHIDGVYLNTFSADGLIISTATGSTAYSLAAGGPIIHPQLEALVLTPISPHTISNRPFVFSPKQKIQIQYLNETKPVEITYDGISQCSLKTGEMFHVTNSTRKFKIISLERHNYFTTLRQKLNWSGQIRNRNIYISLSSRKKYSITT